MGTKEERQQEATNAVLACFQKVSDVTLENFEAVKAEFEKVMEKELPDTGAQQEVLKAEANRVFGFAKQYIEQIKEQQGSTEDGKTKKDEKSKKDEEKKKKAKEEEEEKMKQKKEKEEERRKKEKEKEEKKRREKKKKKKKKKKS